MSFSRDTLTKNQQIKDYRVDQQIGKGSFAVVFKAFNVHSSSPVAIKSIFRSKLTNKKILENLSIEIKILKTVKHPHIVSLIDCVQTSAHFHLIMEYCSLGDLSFLIKKKSQLIKSHPLIAHLFSKYPSASTSDKYNPLNTILVINFLQQLASALKFLREKKLVHRDIKPQNLLLCYPVHSKRQFADAHYSGYYELPILKVADFGFARFLPNQSMAETLCGSPLYMAPEILGCQKYDAKADLWSVGAVLYEMAVGKPPFHANNHIELLKKIETKKDNISFPDKSNFEVDFNVRRVICALLKRKPTERMSFNEFFNDELILTDIKQYLDLDDDENNINDEEQTSSVDENMFISEYLVKKKENDPKTDITALPEIDEAASVSSTINNENSSPSEKKQLHSMKSSAEDNLSNEKSMGTGFDGCNQLITNDRINANNHKDLTTTQSLHIADSDGSQTNSKKIANASTSSGTTSNNNKNYKSLLKQQLDANLKYHSNNQKQIYNVSSSTNLNVNKSSSTTQLLNEKDYVVVEKKSVEVNSLADELATFNTNSNNDFASSRRRRSSSSSQNRQNSLERRFSITLSPSTALSKVVDMASAKLLGTSSNTNNIRVFDPASTSPISQSNLLFSQHNNISASNVLGNSINSYNEQLKLLLTRLESLTTKIDAVESFAIVKYSQLIPMPPNHLHSNSLNNDSAICDDSDDEDEIDNKSHNIDTYSLPPNVMKVIAEEGLAIYLKVLALLSKAINITGEWWASMSVSNSSNNSNIDSIRIQKLNTIVQWLRENFNDCLEKAEFIRLKLNQANRQCGINTTDSKNSNNVKVGERLIFDRALDLSRNAATIELTGHRLEECEAAYSNAIWMLEAILENTELVYNDGSLVNVGLDDEDRLMVEKFIASISNRLEVIKRKVQHNLLQMK